MLRRLVVALVGSGVLLACAVPANAADMKKDLAGVRKYVLVNLLLATMDYESAHAVQHRGGCRESNAVFGHYPARARFYGEGMAIDAGPELVGWLLHRKHARFWRAPFALVAAWHVHGVVTNLRCNSAQP